MFFCIGCVDLRFEIGCSISCELVSELARMFNNVVPSFLRSSLLRAKKGKEQASEAYKIALATTRSELRATDRYKGRSTVPGYQW